MRVLFLLTGGVALISLFSFECRRRAMVFMAPKDVPRSLALGLAASSIVLVQAPVALGAVARIAAVLAFAAGILWALPSRKAGRLSHRVVLLIAVFVAVLAVTLLRGAAEGQVNGSLLGAALNSITYGLVVLFALTLLTTATDKAQRDQILTAFALAPGVYMLTSAALHVAGVAPPQNSTGATSIAADGSASLLAALGYATPRVQFPLSYSINNFGVLAGAALVICVVFYVRSTVAPRSLSVVLALSSVYCLVLSDTRASLGIALAASFVAVFFASRLGSARWFVIGLPFYPFLLLWGLDALSNTDLAADLSRNPSDFATASGRFYIWDGAWTDLLSDFSSQQFIGWGAGGQVTSGASLHYAYYFDGRPQPFDYPAHNVALQTVLDSGYLGLALLMGTLWAAIRGLDRMRDAAGTAMLAGLLVILFSGVTEVSPSYYTAEAMVALLLFLCATAAPDLAEWSDKAETTEVHEPGVVARLQPA